MHALEAQIAPFAGKRLLRHGRRAWKQRKQPLRRARARQLLRHGQRHLAGLPAQRFGRGPFGIKIIYLIGPESAGQFFTKAHALGKKHALGAAEGRVVTHFAGIFHSRIFPAGDARHHETAPPFPACAHAPGPRFAGARRVRLKIQSNARARVHGRKLLCFISRLWLFPPARRSSFRRGWPSRSAFCDSARCRSFSGRS